MPTKSTGRRFIPLLLLIADVASRVEALSASDASGGFSAASANSGVSVSVVRKQQLAREETLLEDTETPGAPADGLSRFYGGSAYHTTFVPLLVLTSVLAWLTRPKTNEPLPPDFNTHVWKYLLVWGMAVGGDWLQGPFVYALYESYGYAPGQIAQLFVAGFGSSMVFGTFIGSLADSWGRKRCAVLYCVLYIVSCLTKHCSLYWMLMIGRITGGMATSLLFSTFECWMVSEHVKRRMFNPSLLRYMFGMMYLVQNCVAIFTGVLAQGAADLYPLSDPQGHWHWGGFTAPFDLAIILLALTIPGILFLWDENYGDEQGRPLSESLATTVRTFRENSKVSLIGLTVTAFEGAMYAFVFNWTPALETGKGSTPHGLIFSSFMMACMCGSSIFSLLNSDMHPACILLLTCGVATVALAVVTACIGSAALVTPVFYAFLVFEVCVGIYFPAMGTLKSAVVPEEARAGVYNTFRVPPQRRRSVSLADQSAAADIFRCALVLACSSGFVFGAPTDRWHAEDMRRKGSRG